MNTLESLTQSLLEQKALVMQMQQQRNFAMDQLAATAATLMLVQEQLKNKLEELKPQTE
mgnify:FL=1